MKTIFLICVGFFALSVPAFSQNDVRQNEGEFGSELEHVVIMPAAQAQLDDFKWRKRVLIVFSQSALDPNMAEQISLLKIDLRALIDRDLIVLIDDEPQQEWPLRTQLRPNGFSLVLIDKDGRTILRKSRPWSVRDLSNAIDRTPLRKQEITERR